VDNAIFVGADLTNALIEDVNASKVNSFSKKEKLLIKK
jgi:hypothetical protein